MNDRYRPAIRLVLILSALSILVTAPASARPPMAAHDDGSSIAAQITGRPTARGNGYVPAYHPELEILPAAGEIRVDGELDDPGWRGAAVADNFAEHNPGDQTRPEVDTEVLVTYDAKNLYLAWICYDDPNEVRATWCERDEIFGDDYVILALDPFAENAVAYEISANPFGIQGDLFFSIGNGEDSTYEMIFESDGRLTPYGWVVEMAIPFAEMRFPDKPVQEWHLDFWRNRPRDSRFQYSWAAYDRDESCWPCQWGTVRGARNIEHGSGLELLPSLIFGQKGERNADGEWKNAPLHMNPFGDPDNGDQRNLDLGLGLSYDISSEITAEATINPDFSQVESDAAQLDINSTFALFYPEKRPFFQEGADLFNTYFTAVYTRSINDPLAAAKVTGRRGGTSVAALSAWDEHTPITLPFEEGSVYIQNGEAATNIVRVRQELGDQTYLGGVVTDRRYKGGGNGTLGGLDGSLRLTQNDKLEGQVLFSHTVELDGIAVAADWNDSTTFDEGRYTRSLDGETFDGHAVYASYERDTEHFGFDIDYWERSPTWRAEAGFEPGNAYRMTNFTTSYQFRFEEDTSLLETITPTIDGGRKWNFEGTKKDEWINGHLSWAVRKYQTSFHARGMYSNELYHGIQFDDIWLAHICGTMRPGKTLYWGGNYNYGHRIARYHEVMGKETVWGLWATVRPGDRLVITNSLDRISSDHVDTDERLFSDTINRTTISYQFSREFSARVILQYRDRDKIWEADPLITYKINPLSTFFLGSTRDYRDLEPQTNGAEGWRLTSRQYFMKLQYLFRI